MLIVEAESTLAHDLQELSNDVRFLKDELGYLNRRITRHSQSISMFIFSSQKYTWSCVLVDHVSNVVTNCSGIFSSFVSTKVF
jgi:hypothetical protein